MPISAWLGIVVILFAIFAISRNHRKKKAAASTSTSGTTATTGTKSSIGFWQQLIGGILALATIALFALGGAGSYAWYEHSQEPEKNRQDSTILLMPMELESVYRDLSPDDRRRLMDGVWELYDNELNRIE
jgi:hypothetical protein